MKQRIFIGNYPGNGINQIEFENGKVIHENLKIGNAKNNSYVCKYKNYLYTVIEIEDEKEERNGYILTYEIKEKETKFLNSVTSGGGSPCFLIVDESRDILYVANYSGGSFAAFKIEENGSVGKRLYSQKYENNSKVHHIQFSKDYKRVYVIDSGNDCIIEYNINYNSHELNLKEINKFNFPNQTHPRHMVIDENDNIYVVTEKTCEIYKLSHMENKLIIKEKKSILPEDIEIKENYTGCAIKMDSKNRYIYVAVRGHDSISAFEITEIGMTLIQSIKCEGKIPRDISFDIEEKYLICGNQESNNITIFNILKGRLIYENRYEIKSPTCIIVT